MRGLPLLGLWLLGCDASVNLFPRVDAGARGPPLATDCAQLGPFASDGPVSVTLFTTVAEAPYSAWCGSDGGTWLVLPRGASANRAMVMPGGAWLGTPVETTFDAIRIVPPGDGGAVYDVVKADLSFATSSGRVVNRAGDWSTTFAAYLSPTDCAAPESSTALASGDLGGTPFVFVRGGLAITGFRPGGSIVFSPENRAVEVSAGGYCGGIANDGPLQLRVCGAPTPEVCDGLDNDCNGLADDVASNCP